jgi:hypothetical protein
MASSQFTYDRHLQRYRFKSSGKFVSQAAVENLVRNAAIAEGESLSSPGEHLDCSCSDQIKL